MYMYTFACVCYLLDNSHCLLVYSYCLIIYFICWLFTFSGYSHLLFLLLFVCLQVIHGEQPKQLTLYVLAQDANQQTEWVDALRECKSSRRSVYVHVICKYKPTQCVRTCVKGFSNWNFALEPCICVSYLV